jgi:hypothetical protein
MDVRAVCGMKSVKCNVSPRIYSLVVQPGKGDARTTAVIQG